MFRFFYLWKQYECSIELILQKHKHALVETLHLDSAFAISFSKQNQLKHITNECSFAFQTPLPNPEYITVKTIHKDVLSNQLSWNS